MAQLQPVTWFLAIGSIAVVISTIPYGLVGIDYRDRDNGLAFLLFVVGLAVWNVMFIAQLLSPVPRVKVFFLGLSVVGSVQAGLGWFLFATTASSTSRVLDRRGAYAAVGVLGGLDTVLAVTTPVHPFYWGLGTVDADPLGFASIDPAMGYWLHTAFLVGLFGTATALFLTAWWDGAGGSFARVYTLAGIGCVLLIVGSNVAVPGGLTLAPLAVAILSTAGWLQASRGKPLAWLRSLG